MENKIVTIPELKAMLAAGERATLLDVRTEAEHEEGHLPGMWIPLNELAQRVSELNPEENIIIYCHAGPRSIQAMQILQAANFKSVKYLQGGYSCWCQTA